MKLGVIFPQTEMGSRPGDAKKYAEAADSLGYNHLTVYDHVLGADMSYHSNLVGAAYTLEDQFYEPLYAFRWRVLYWCSVEIFRQVSPYNQKRLIS